MIREILVPAMRRRFPSAPFEYLDQDAPFAVLPSPCPEIGRLELFDDGDEVTVYLTEITHGHFSCYDEDATREEKERRVAESVLDFLAALLADRVVIYRVIGGLAGGWTTLDASDPLPSVSRMQKQYVWSGALV